MVVGGKMMKEFQKYHQDSIDIGDIDYPLLKVKAKDLVESQKIWLAFIYSLCYAEHSAWVLFNEYKHKVRKMTDAQREQWWLTVKNKVKFITDKRWVKSLNAYLPCIKGFENMTQGNAWEWFKKQEDGGEKALRTLPQYGRFSWFLFAELVEILCDVKIDNDRLDMSEAGKIKEAVEYIYKKDMTNQEALEKFREICDYVGSDMWGVETNLCAYVKHKKDGRRWIGYYVERKQKEANFIRKHWGDVYR